MEGIIAVTKFVYLKIYLRNTACTAIISDFSKFRILQLLLGVGEGQFDVPLAPFIFQEELI